MLSAVKQKYLTPPESGGARVNNFNIIRFIAAALVLYGHMATLMGEPAPSLFYQSAAAIGVKIFFLISGFLITKSFLNDSHFGRYMVRRVFRIFPGLIAVTLFTVLIVGPIMTALPVGRYFRSLETWSYLRNIFLYPVFRLPGVFGGSYPNGGTVNGSLWPIPVGFLMYLILPLFVVIFKKLRILKQGIFAVAVMFLAATVIQRLYFPEASLVIYGTDVCNILILAPYFFIGSFWSLIDYKKYINIQLAAILLFIFAIMTVGKGHVYVYSEIVTCVLLSYFIFSFAYVDRPIFGNWFSKCDFSYGIYLYSFLVQQIVYHQLKKLFDPSLNLTSLICFIIALLCGVVSWYLVEKPAQELGKKILKRLTKPDAA